jgi:DNA modification methylase
VDGAAKQISFEFNDLAVVSNYNGHVQSKNSKRANRELNKLSPLDRSAHGWYRFVLSFPPHIVRDYLQRFGITANKRVLDPFCGTGTTLVECKKLGIPSIGVEANPMAYFASQIKVDWSVPADGLISHAHEVADAALKELIRHGINDKCHIDIVQTLPIELRTIPEALQNLLLTNSISPLPLHKTLILLEKIDQHTDKSFQKHEKLALAKALVSSVANLHFGPEVGVGRPKTDAVVIGSWMDSIQNMVHDLHELKKRRDVPSVVYQADSRQILQVVEPNSIDAVITSPPYPNEKDYTRTTRLESVLLGFVRSKADLQNVKRCMVRSNTRSTYKEDDDDRWVADHPEIQQVAEDIEARRIELGKTSGFERLYARITKLYFGGMARHLADLRYVLRPGAHLAYVVGDQASYLRILIRTGHILADIAQSLGYELVGIDLFRTRLATATKAQLREEVVVLRWSGNHI